MFLLVIKKGRRFLKQKPQCLKRQLFCVSNFGDKKGWWFLNWKPRCPKYKLFYKVKLFDQILSTFSIQTSILAIDVQAKVKYPTDGGWSYYHSKKLFQVVARRCLVTYKSSISFSELLEWIAVWIKSDGYFNSVFTQDMHEHPHLDKDFYH